MIGFQTFNASSLISLGVYLLQSYAIYRLASVRCLPNPFFAFIPFFQLYMFGGIGDTLRYQNRSINNLLGQIPLTYALPLLTIAGSILRYPLSLLTSMVLAMGMLVVYYMIFGYYSPRQKILFTLIAGLSLIGSVLAVLVALPGIGKVFAPVYAIVMLFSSISTIGGPLVVLYCLRGRR